MLSYATRKSVRETSTAKMGPYRLETMWAEYCQDCLTASLDCGLRTSQHQNDHMGSQPRLNPKKLVWSIGKVSTTTTLEARRSTGVSRHGGRWGRRNDKWRRYVYCSTARKYSQAYTQVHYRMEAAWKVQVRVLEKVEWPACRVPCPLNMLCRC